MMMAPSRTYLSRAEELGTLPGEVVHDVKRRVVRRGYLHVARAPSHLSWATGATAGSGHALKRSRATSSDGSGIVTATSQGARSLCADTQNGAICLGSAVCLVWTVSKRGKSSFEWEYMCCNVGADPDKEELRFRSSFEGVYAALCTNGHPKELAHF
jgi:hypothetical protein